MPDKKIKALTELHADINTRVGIIREANADWLCRMGCDHCCKRLAEIPVLSAAEWDWLRDGLSVLPLAQLSDIARSVAALDGQASRPFTCPMLDQAAGVCMVYDYRPVACRTYGFYVQRDKGLYCQDIESRVAAGDWHSVVWGNQDAVDHRLQGLGETRSLTEWFVRWKVDFELN